MKRSVAGLLAAVVLSVFAVASAQLDLTFDKSAIADGVWAGRVDGDVSGRLVTVLLAADQTQPVWQVDFYWIVLADDPSQSFLARLQGTLDSESGAVVMSGSVTDGYRAGASVREAGQLQDAETSNFTGTIEVADMAAHREPAPVGAQVLSAGEATAVHGPNSPEFEGLATQVASADAAPGAGDDARLERVVLINPVAPAADRMGRFDQRLDP